MMHFNQTKSSTEWDCNHCLSNLEKSFLISNSQEEDSPPTRCCVYSTLRTLRDMQTKFHVDLVERSEN